MLTFHCVGTRIWPFALQHCNLELQQLDTYGVVYPVYPFHDLCQKSNTKYKL